MNPPPNNALFYPHPGPPPRRPICNLSGILFALAFLAVTSAFGQGDVIFSNFPNFVPGNAVVVDIDGTTLLAGPAYTVQLYAGPTELDLAPVNPTTTFLERAAAGYFNFGTLKIPTVPAGELAYVQVHVWETAFGATYEEAVANGGKHGVSLVTSVVTGHAGSPPSLPAPLSGLKPFGLEIETQTMVVPAGFSMIANPLFRGNNTVVEVLPSVPEGTILFRYDGVSKIYSVNVFDFGQWTHPEETFAPGEGAFILNPNNVPAEVTFIGTSTRPPPRIQQRLPGFSMVGCPDVQPCRIEDRLAFPPKEGDTVYRFDSATQLYHLSVYQFNNWQGFPPVMAPGEALFINLVP